MRSVDPYRLDGETVPRRGCVIDRDGLVGSSPVTPKIHACFEFLRRNLGRRGRVAVGTRLERSRLWGGPKIHREILLRFRTEVVLRNIVHERSLPRDELIGAVVERLPFAAENDMVRGDAGIHVSHEHP